VKKIILATLVFCGICFLCTDLSFAKPVKKEKVTKAAKTFLAVRYPTFDPNSVRTLTKKGRSALCVKEVLPLRVNEKLVGYVVDLEPTGFVLFSGDDEMPPVKIYSDTGSYKRLPEGLQRVLELELLEDNTTVTSTSKKNQYVLLKIKRFSVQWNYLTSGEIQNNNVESYLTGTPGTAILTTTWHQNDPYNFYAPTAGGGPGDRAWAGCTATALAQVLRHHRLPALVASNHTYVDNAGACQGTHSINDAGMGAYDWPNMPSSISTSSPEAEKQAVGQLIYHCGVALESNYEANMTSAFPSSVPSVLRTFFNYTCGNYLAKSNYTDTQWYAKIENDIDNDRPAFYAMWEADGSDGHAVVCDGYRNGNEIHLDMGWSGAWTAWYNIDSVAANGYTWTIHGAVFNITPPTNQAPLLYNPWVTPSSGTDSTSFEFTVDYYDPDDDPPDDNYRRVYISGLGYEQMTLKSGSADDGTYHYTTTLPVGSYSYMFFFADEHGLSDITNWQSGPYVYSDDDAVINIVIQCSRISSDLRLQYSLVGFNGPWIDLPITKSRLDPLPVPAGSTIYFKADVGSPNYQYREWELWENGTRIAGTTSSMFSFTLGTETTEVGLNVFYDYTPQNYTISGTVLCGDTTPIPGGVDLVLTSDQQTMSQNTTDGNFSFTSVHGGVSVTITPSAAGYGFSPANLVYHNLADNYTGVAIIGYASDVFVPTTSFLTVPPAVSENSAVSFSWTGSDDISPPANLLYQYKLDGVDADWSAWVSDTSKGYDLTNGAYTFWVRAKDEAENINQAPISYKFVINAAPRVASTTRIDRRVSASRVTLEMPESPSHPNDVFVLLPEHSGMGDSELVPISIHYVDDSNSCGASAYVAAELGITERITKASTGYLVSLPNSVPLGQTAQYDIIWGKIAYFGWKEFVSIPLNFPNGGQCWDSFLDDDLKLWRLATKNLTPPGYGTHTSWVYMNSSDRNGPVIDEQIIRQQFGEFDGSYGFDPYYLPGYIFGGNSRIYYIWTEERNEYSPDTGNPGYTHSILHQRYGLNVFGLNGLPINSWDYPSFLEKSIISLPRKPAHNSLWTLVDVWGETPKRIYFLVNDIEGNELIGETTFDTIQSDYYCGFGRLASVRIGENVLLIWVRKWKTADGYRREEINYEVRDGTGGIVRLKTALISVLPDEIQKDDKYKYSTSQVLTDNNGKVWISITHTQTGQADEYFYVVLGTDGSIWKGPIQRPSLRTFSFCDRDGYIWTTEGGQFLVLNDDDTTAVAQRVAAYIPNQHIGNIAASVAQDGYRLYDRWSPQIVGIDMPSSVNANSMHLFALNLWDNDLNTADPNLMKGDTPVWSHSGQFTGHTTIDVSGILNEGQNILTMTQDDFLGGQVLVTFPYVIPVTGDITGDGKVNFKDLKILAEQWLQPPGIPSADIAPDNIVNFKDFAVLAENWLAGK